MQKRASFHQKHYETVFEALPVGNDRAVYFDARAISLPYSEGFTVTVDGIPTETYAVGESLTAAYVPIGTHDIRVTYTAPGFTAGLVVTIFAAVGLGVAVAIGLVRRKRKS